MIVRTEREHQIITGSLQDDFLKEVIMTRGDRIAMVRKRRLNLVTREPMPTRGCVLLVHGFGQNRYTWHTSKRSFSGYLAHHGFDVFNVDLRGHGRSARYDGRRPVALDEYIEEDLPSSAEAALRLSGKDQVNLVGHSMGGLVSYSAASTHLRGMVRSIVSLGSPYAFGSGSLPMRVLAGVLGAARITGVFDDPFNLPLRQLGSHLRNQRKVWNSRLFPTPVRAWRPGSIEMDILEEYLRTSFETTNLAIAFDIFSGGDRVALHSTNGRVDYGMAFETLSIPLMVMAGADDDLAPPESCKAAFDRSKSEHKFFRVFPAGHADIVIGREAVTTIWPTALTFLNRFAID